MSALPTAAELAGIAPAHGRHVRLLLLTDTPVLAAGGSERFLRNLIAGLPADGYEITVVQLNAQLGEGIERAPVFARPNVKVQVIPVDAVYGRRGLRALWALRRRLRDEPFDIVQSHHEKADLLNALLPRRPGRLHVSNRRDLGFKKSRKLRQAFRLVNHRFDAVVAPALEILVALAGGEGVDRQRTVWIPNGVDTGQFRPPSPAERLRARSELGLGASDLVLGCAARLVPVKRHVDLVAAFAVLHAQRSEARLLLVGDGPLRDDIRRQAEALGIADAVLLAGNREDIDAVLPALDIAVLASSSEGMSNALLEAMACGLPIIATTVGANGQLVQHGENGLLCPPCEPDVLAQAMLELAEAPVRRRAMGNASRARVQADHSVETMINAYERMYQRLLEPA
ncbi:glycosyltransferase [Lysobacter sp. F6437]|uniref:glycosyltransferase n=1 Tax=Lysobacter sp. F6437 TaxID=3459296 RepID=UPI00403DE6C6